MATMTDRTEIPDEDLRAVLECIMRINEVLPMVKPAQLDEARQLYEAGSLEGAAAIMAAGWRDYDGPRTDLQTPRRHEPLVPKKSGPRRSYPSRINRYTKK